MQLCHGNKWIKCVKKQNDVMIANETLYIVKKTRYILLGM